MVEGSISPVFHKKSISSNGIIITTTATDVKPITPSEKLSNWPQVNIKDEEKQQQQQDDDDYATRCLNICRKIPCCGIFLSFGASLFFGVASLTAKINPNVNPFIMVIIQ